MKGAFPIPPGSSVSLEGRGELEKGFWDKNGVQGEVDRNDEMMTECFRFSTPPNTLLTALKGL